MGIKWTSGGHQVGIKWPGLEKVLYPGILVTSQFPIWQPIFGWVENDASRYMRVDSRLLARPMTQPAIKH